MSRRYDPTRAALLRPADAPGFDGWLPTNDNTLAAELSRVVYGDDLHATRAALGRVGLRLEAVFDAGGTYGLLAVPAADAPPQRSSLLVFRGTRTDTPQNLLDDALAVLAPWPTGGRVHLGFARALDRVWGAVATALRAHTGPLLFAGHSLGGALATLAAARATPAGLLTYGCPRVGDQEFADALDCTVGREHTRRFVHCSDLVCTLPPRPYRHAGPTLYIDRHGGIHAAPGRAARLSDGAAARLRYLADHARDSANLPIRDLADHAPVNYVSALRDAPPHAAPQDSPMEPV